MFLFEFISLFVFFGVCIYVWYFFDAVRNRTSNRKYLLGLIKRRSKVYQKNMSCERTSNFDKLTIFSENNKKKKSLIMVCSQNY